MKYTCYMTKPGKYQITKKDIDTALRFLESTDPEHATPEMAIELLEHLQSTFHTLSHENPESLAKIYQDLRKQKQESRN